MNIWDNMDNYCRSKCKFKIVVFKSNVLQNSDCWKSSCLEYSSCVFVLWLIMVNIYCWENQRGWKALRKCSWRQTNEGGVTLENFQLYQILVCIYKFIFSFIFLYMFLFYPSNSTLGRGVGVSNLPLLQNR